MVNYSHLEEKEEEEDSSSYFSSYSSLNFGIYVFRIPSFSPIFFRSILLRDVSSFPLVRSPRLISNHFRDRSVNYFRL